MIGSSGVAKNISILVVEDEALIAEEIQDRLERMMYRVVGLVDTGAAAIECATTARPDLILMDIRLKGAMLGIEAADHIYRKLGIPSVFVTSHSDPDTIKRATRSGQFGYVLKPFEEGALQAAIEMALMRHSLDRDLKTRQITQAAMIECASDAIIGQDLNGTILSWNPAAEKLFGYSAAEAVGQNTGFIVPDGCCLEELCAALDRIRNGESIELPATERRRKDGSLPEVWISISPVRDPEGNVVGAVKIGRDISARRKAERTFLES